MIVTAWNNGAHSRNGAGYGFRVTIEDRDEHFKEEWETIVLEIEGEEQTHEVELNKEGLWSEDCREIRSAAIGKWLRERGIAPWPKGNPPYFELNPIEDNRFTVSTAQKKSGSKPF